MTNINAIKERLKTLKATELFSKLYGDSDEIIENQQKRYIDSIDKFVEIYKDSSDIQVFSTPGRTEVCGNHTDHNFGKVLAASIDLDIIAVVSLNNSNNICVKSKGYEKDTVDIDHTTPVTNERFRSVSLIRGICARFKQLGYVIGGFDAYTINNVIKGSGLSSSAAFEVMIATIINHLFCKGEVSNIEIAKIAQYAENVYFGKPCGLMDQIACSVGGFVSIDFLDPAEPKVEKIRYDLADSGHALVIVNTGGSHADLNEDYAALTQEMKSVAKVFDKAVLRNISLDELLENITKVRELGNDRAILRAIHFFNENKRVDEQADALNRGDFELFKKSVIESGDSSQQMCQNCYSCSNYKDQPISLALAVSRQLLKKSGAWRVHGGGFAGTIQVFVPFKMIDDYIEKMSAIFGEGSCYKLMIRPYGSIKLDL